MEKNTGREFFIYHCYTIWIIKSKISKKYLKNVHCWGGGTLWYPVAKPNRKGSEESRMGQTKQPASKSMESLQRATDTLSTLLAQEVRELNARQKTARKAADKDGPADPGSFKGLKEATAVLKDLAAVARALNEQGVEAEGTVCGVVLLPSVEEA